VVWGWGRWDGDKQALFTLAQASAEAGKFA